MLLLHMVNTNTAVTMLQMLHPSMVSTAGSLSMANTWTLSDHLSEIVEFNGVMLTTTPCDELTVRSVYKWSSLADAT